MHIAIFGAGGVGGYFGGRLAQAGEDVTFIARGQHLQAIQQNGLRVDSVLGDFVIHPAQATTDPATIGPVDAVLVAVKAWQVPAAAEAIKPLVGPKTIVVPLQNGVEAPAQLTAALGPQPVLAGLCGLVTYVEGPGHIRHAGVEPFVKFGELDNSRSKRVERLYQAFAGAQGLVVEVPPDIHVAVWQKFMLIVAWSGVGAVTRAPVGVLRTIPETRRMLEDVVQEVYTVGRAHNVALPETSVARTMTFFDNALPENTASMQRDVMEGRPSELESQTGAVVRLGQEKGVETPLNSYIYHTLLPMELQARGK